ncbi:MAG: hypothetical protein ACLSUW_07260 [Akkermansia sp.]
MKYQTLNILLLPFLLAAMLAGIYLMPRKGEVFDSSISMELPTGLNPDGWHGTRRQDRKRSAAFLPRIRSFQADYAAVAHQPGPRNRPCAGFPSSSPDDLNNSIHLGTRLPARDIQPDGPGCKFPEGRGMIE